MDIANLSNLVEQSHVVLLSITAPLGAMLALAKFKHGNLRLSQSKTKRFYALVCGKEKWRTASSAALQVAVKDAIGIELPGDVIRFSLDRDSPITVLKAFKDTRGLVRLKPDGLDIEDRRENPRLTYRRKFDYFVIAALLVYLSMILASPFLKDHVPIAFITLWMLASIVAMQVLLFTSLKYLMADRLLRIDEVYPRPSGRFGQSTSASTSSSSRKTARLMSTDSRNGTDG
jgi:hypothetical protein